ARALREGVRDARRGFARARREPPAAAARALLRDRRRRGCDNDRTADPRRGLRPAEGGRRRRRRTDRGARRRPPPNQLERRTPRSRPGASRRGGSSGAVMSSERRIQARGMTAQTETRFTPLPDEGTLTATVVALEEHGYSVEGRRRP